MEGTRDITINSLIAVRQEHERLQTYMNFLKMENLEYALKCNRMQNAIMNIEAVIRQNPKKLADASENLCGILASCRSQDRLPPTSSTRSVGAKVSPTKDNAPKCNKAHVVKPHMVNGTILYIPTINLTRVSDMHLIKESVNENSENEGDDSTLERNDDESEVNRTTVSNDMEPGTSSSGTQEFDSDNQTSRLEDASRSPSHSTVLSGTFQEVKIFLNQISPDRLQESSRKSKSLRRSSLKRKVSSGCVTRRKRS